MNNESGFQDETMNLFKLKLYNWNVNDAIKYYKNDKFCMNYCIDKNYKYGCRNKQCPYKHSINLRTLVFGSSKQEPDCKQAEFVCLYLMYQQKYNDNNPQLFNVYAWILDDTGKSEQDYLKSEKYYLKSLAIDNNYSNTHNNYAVLLENQLNNHDKAEYHYNESLKIDPNNAMGHCNFAVFLIFKRRKYQLALSHSEKACQIRPNYSKGHFMKAVSLYKLNKFELSLEEYQKCLKFNEKDGNLLPFHVKDAQKQIDELTNKTGKRSGMNSQKRESNDEKSDATNIASDLNVSKFDQLSIIEGIDDIMKHIIQIEEMVHDNNIKQSLSIVQKKLTSTRTKCKAMDGQDKNNPELGYNNLRLRIQTLTKEIQSRDDSTLSITLSMLAELKKIEQETQIRKQKIVVSTCTMFVCSVVLCIVCSMTIVIL